MSDEVQSRNRTPLDAVSRYVGHDEKGTDLFCVMKDVKGKRKTVGHAKLGRRAGDIMWRPSLGPVVRDLET